MLNEKLYAAIDAMEPEFVAMLQKWIRVPSVKAEAQEGAPFGPVVRDMLDMALADAEAMGFTTRNFDGYAGDIVLGDKEEELAVLGHLDVVPAGDGWTMDPFGATIVDGKMYGRGTSDDKGPSLCALFAMKALKDAGIPLKKSIKLILGCDEESGWEDMDYYSKHAKMPEEGFSPDASFPLINTEKGMVHMTLTAPIGEGASLVKELFTGERLNVIPGESRALLCGGQELADKVAAYAQQTGLPYTATVTAEGVEVVAEGIPGHSAYPWGRRNAIGMMLLLLRELGVAGTLKTIADAVPMEWDGTHLGIKCEDEISGPLTCNMGILHLENGIITATLDCRCPVAADLDWVVANATAALPGIDVTVCEKKAPHHVPADGELVTNLLAAYHEETGLPAEAASTGGGTYAKVLKQGVAFGASFPDDEDLAHQAGEYVYIAKMMKSIKIFANAMVRLCGE